jgi:leucyl-tRNA synthetase
MSKFDFDAIEKKWQKKWDDVDLYKTGEDTSKESMYCLDYFPYPSGAGLSVGHCKNYVPTDTFSRYFRMKGFNVLHPTGWDAFGLPAENYAIKMGVHPEETTRINTQNYKRQMRLIGTTYDWNREVNSSSPEYYKWTQWFFLLLFERGLAYQDFGLQWWCDDCKTVLANEQVEDGKCWRCGHEARKKDLKQWFFKITDYADRLIDDLENVDWPEPIKIMQRNWINRSHGAKAIFTAETGDEIEIFTTRPDTLFGATYMVLAPEHKLVPKLTKPDKQKEIEEYIKQSTKASEVERLSTDKEKTGIFTGSYATNPVNGEKIPIWIGDYVLVTYGTGAIMCVPAHDVRDFAFATKYKLPIIEVISPDGNEHKLEEAYTEPGTVINSGEHNGLNSEEFKKVITEWLEKNKKGCTDINYKMRDWLISRQRYWGAPIPIIHCEKCGAVPVPKDQLPVKLPHVHSFEPAGDGKSPLARVDEFVNTTCPKCGGKAKRETDTMDGFACSSWYFLRYASPHETDRPFDPEKVDYWLPVDVYVGGAEHAVMHLIYARFWTKVMFDAGLVKFSEPFTKLLNQGMLLGSDHQKMSKSKGNVVTPDSMVKLYGADALRGYILFMGPFEGEVIWEEKGCAGVHRFLGRLWEMVTENKYGESEIPDETKTELQRLQHKLILKVTSDIENFRFNTSVSSFMETYNNLSKYTDNPTVTSSKIWKEVIESYLILLAPICPYITEEMWEIVGNTESIHLQSWPIGDEKLAIDQSVKIPIQVNGKLRDMIIVPIGTPEEKLEELALTSEKVQKYIGDKKVVKVIIPKGKLVSIVVK